MFAGETINAIAESNTAVPVKIYGIDKYNDIIIIIILLVILFKQHITTPHVWFSGYTTAGNYMQCFQTAAATFTPAYLAGTTATLPGTTAMVYQVAYDGSVTMSGTDSDSCILCV